MLDGSMPNSRVKRLQDRIADAQHDIESIGIQLEKPKEPSVALDQGPGLRGLQEMYRKRIAKLDTEIASVPNPGEATSETLPKPVQPGVGPSEIISLKDSKAKRL